MSLFFGEQLKTTLSCSKKDFYFSLCLSLSLLAWVMYAQDKDNWARSMSRRSRHAYSVRTHCIYTYMFNMLIYGRLRIMPYIQGGTCVCEKSRACFCFLLLSWIMMSVSVWQQSMLKRCGWMHFTNVEEIAVDWFLSLSFSLTLCAYLARRDWQKDVPRRHIHVKISRVRNSLSRRSAWYTHVWTYCCSQGKNKISLMCHEATLDLSPCITHSKVSCQPVIRARMYSVFSSQTLISACSAVTRSSFPRPLSAWQPCYMSFLTQ